MTSDQRDNLIGRAGILALAATLVAFLMCAGCTVEHLHLYTEQKCSCDSLLPPPTGADPVGRTAPVFDWPPAEREPDLTIEVTP